MSPAAMWCSCLDRAIIGVSILGVIISTYALYVEIMAEANADYKPMCDLHETASCSRVLTSKYAKGFGVVPPMIQVPNSVIGIFFYCTNIILTTFRAPIVVCVQFFFSLMGLLASFYLAYLLIVVIKDICVVCISTYLINIGIALLVYYRFRNAMAIYSQSNRCR